MNQSLPTGLKPGAKKVLIRLAATRALGEAQKFVIQLEDSYGFVWRPVGDRENNYGSINIGSDPGHALVERVTNAIDAVIEREAIRRLKKSAKESMPASPREAVEAWFKIPGGRVGNLSIAKRQALSDEVVLRILEGRNKHPTIEVQDAGVGLTSSLIPKTILSLGGSNKIDKPYLAGAYGQGGSTALAFSQHGTLLVTRRQRDLLAPGESDEVAVTFVRFNELDPEVNKNGRYEYLVQPNREVASLAAEDAKLQAFGTTVVHFEMDIARYAARLTQLTGSLWWLLQNTLFDPVLPFWAEERRASMLETGAKSQTRTKEADRRTIAGNFTRLTDDKKERIEHSESVDVLLPHKEGDTSIKVNYWVVRQTLDGTSSQPIDAYVDPYRPITFTFFGQTHGTEERRFTAERLSLPYLAKFLIIQVELDNLTPAARRELLSTTRDRLKQLPFYDLMRELICSALAEDEDLIRLNEERKERILSRQSENEQQKMRERFARLMERFKAGVDARAPAKGGSGGGRATGGGHARQPLEPLPTKKRPTFIRIANTQKPIPVRLDRHALVRLESDAPTGYLASHVHAKLTVVAEPDGIITLESRSDFRGGRSRLTVRPTTKAKAGQKGKLTVFLFTPEGGQLKASTTFLIEKPAERPTSGKAGKLKVQVPTPEPVYKDQWGEFGWDARNVALVAEDARETQIFVNMDNMHISRLLHTGGYQETGLQRMKNNYLLYTAFYAWMKHIADKAKDSELVGQAFEEYQQQEYDRVAQTVVHAIAASSRLMDAADD